MLSNESSFRRSNLLTELAKEYLVFDSHLQGFVFIFVWKRYLSQLTYPLLYIKAKTAHFTIVLRKMMLQKRCRSPNSLEQDFFNRNLLVKWLRKLTPRKLTKIILLGAKKTRKVTPDKKLQVSS
jgi:hypothetical protein